MKISTKIALIVLAVIVLVSTVAVLTPRATHANANSTLNAIAADATRIPWSTSCTLSTPGLYLDGECQPATPTPAGFDVVVQSITFWCPSLEMTPLTTAPPVWITRLAHQTGGNYMEWAEQFPAAILSPYGYGFERSFPVTLYLDPETIPTCMLGAWNVTAVAAPAGQQDNISCYLEGYAVPIVSTKPGHP